MTVPRCLGSPSSAGRCLPPLELWWPFRWPFYCGDAVWDRGSSQKATKPACSVPEGTRTRSAVCHLVEAQTPEPCS